MSLFDVSAEVSVTETNFTVSITVKVWFGYWLDMYIITTACVSLSDVMKWRNKVHGMGCFQGEQY